MLKARGKSKGNGDKINYLIGRYLNRGIVEHRKMFESVFDLVGNF